MADQAILEKIYRAGDTANTFGSRVSRLSGLAVETIAGLELVRDVLTLTGDALHRVPLAAIEPTAVSTAGDIGLIAVGAIMAGPVARYFENQVGQHRQTS